MWTCCMKCYSRQKLLLLIRHLCNKTRMYQEENSVNGICVMVNGQIHFSTGAGCKLCFPECRYLSEKQMASARVFRFSWWVLFKWWSSWFLCCVVWWVCSDVLEEGAVCTSTVTEFDSGGCFSRTQKTVIWEMSSTFTWQLLLQR